MSLVSSLTRFFLEWFEPIPDRFSDWLSATELSDWKSDKLVIRTSSSSGQLSSVSATTTATTTTTATLSPPFKVVVNLFFQVGKRCKQKWIAMATYR